MYLIHSKQIHFVRLMEYKDDFDSISNEKIFSPFYSSNYTSELLNFYYIYYTYTIVYNIFYLY